MRRTKIFCAVLAIVLAGFWICFHRVPKARPIPDNAVGYDEGFRAGAAGDHVCVVVDRSPSSEFTLDALRGWIDAQKRGQ
jgi:hypothetical protein